MTRQGSMAMGLLDDLHGQGCDGTEYSACRPVVIPAHGPDRVEPELQVVFMKWCGSCEAADWDYL